MVSNASFPTIEATDAKLLSLRKTSELDAQFSIRTTEKRAILPVNRALDYEGRNLTVFE